MTAPTQATIAAKHTHNTTESTDPPKKVNTHTNNITNTVTKTNYEQKNGGQRGNDDGDDNIASLMN